MSITCPILNVETQTPSPHRFLPAPRPSRQKSPPKDSRRADALKRQQPVQQEATPQRPSFKPSVKQFANTPQFSAGRPRPAQLTRHEWPVSPVAAQAFRPARPTEDVYEVPTATVEDEEMLDVEQAAALPTTEITQSGDNEQSWSHDLPYSPKRRKLEDARRDELSTHGMDSTSGPLFKQPTTPASHYLSGPEHFSRAGSVASTVGDGAFRPAFLRSSVFSAHQERREPVPEVFSPHRRGEKYVPGGMAGLLQQWVIETGQSAAQGRRGQSHLNGEDYALQVRATSVSGIGPILVHGNRGDNGDVRLLLVNSKREPREVGSGSLIGIRAPTWEVAVKDELWVVGVDWKLL